MPKNSRRLPGGKVRRPADRRRQKRPAAALPPASPAEPSPSAVASTTDGAGGAQGIGFSARPAPVPASGAGRRDAVAARAGGARAGAAAIRQRVAGQRTPARQGRSLMDLAAANYAHLRSDLIRIAVLSTVMLGIIVALYFVLEWPSTS